MARLSGSLWWLQTVGIFSYTFQVQQHGARVSRAVVCMLLHAGTGWRCLCGGKVGCRHIYRDECLGMILGQLWAHEQQCKPGLSAFNFMATGTSAGMCLAAGASDRSQGRVGYLSI